MLAPAETTVMFVELAGAELGDPVLCGHSGVQPATHLVQLSAASDEGRVQITLRNGGQTPVDVGDGRLKVAVVKLDVLPL